MTMGAGVFQRVGVFVLLGAMQVVVMNSIHLFGCATPLIYVYFAYLFDDATDRLWSMLSCFALGIVMDIFVNSPGAAATAMTLMGFLRPVLSRGERWKTWGAILALTLLYCAVFYAVLGVAFVDIVYYARCVMGSTVLTSLFILTIEGVRK